MHTKFIVEAAINMSPEKLVLLYKMQKQFLKNTFKKFRFSKLVGRETNSFAINDLLYR